MPEECAEAGFREPSNKIMSYIHYCQVGISLLSVRKSSLLLTSPALLTSAHVLRSGDE